MKEILEDLLGCIESQSYTKAFGTLSSLIDEDDAFEDGFSLDEKTELDVLYSCLHFIVSEKGDGLYAERWVPQTVDIYKRLAFLLVKKLIGDKTAATEIETLMFCKDAMADLRQN